MFKEPEKEEAKKTRFPPDVDTDNNYREEKFSLGETETLSIKKEKDNNDYKLSTTGGDKRTIEGTPSHQLLIYAMKVKIKV